MGFRFRVDRSPLRGLRNRADVVFGPTRVAVFVDGCFWHCCPEHGSIPRNNRQWWTDKLAANVERDRRVDNQLAAADWCVVRVWEHEPASQAAARVAEHVLRRRPVA